MGPDALLNALLQGWAALVGLALGSFLNVCIGRMPEDRSVISPPSACPSCGTGIAWYDNLPVVSWVLLRARCRACGVGISPLYPVIELLMGALSLLLFRHLVPVQEAFPVAEMAAWGVYLIFLFMLVGSTFIDLRHYIIPDEFTIYAAPFGVLAALGLSTLGYQGELALTWQQSVAGAVIGGGILGALIAIWWVVRRIEGMGFGDVKLLAMMGAFLGAIPAIPFIVFVSSLAGSAVGIGMMIKQRRGLRLQLPFGPFLALGGVLYVFFGQELVQAFLPGLLVVGI